MAVQISLYNETAPVEKRAFQVNVKKLSKKKVEEIGFSKSLKTLKKNMKEQGIKCE